MPQGNSPGARASPSTRMGQRDRSHITPYLPLVGISHLLPWALWVLRPCGCDPEGIQRQPSPPWQPREKGRGAGSWVTEASCDSHAVSQWLEQGLGAQPRSKNETKQISRIPPPFAPGLLLEQTKSLPTWRDFFHSFCGLEIKDSAWPLHPQPSRGRVTPRGAEMQVLGDLPDRGTPQGKTNSSHNRDD